VLGEVTGPYREVPAGDGADGLPHRRDVRWHGEVPRDAVRPTAQLQDPRSLFQVRLSPTAAAAPGPAAG
jgi:predicted Mrr-cat superfamily restriction endonuclease